MRKRFNLLTVISILIFSQSALASMPKVIAHTMRSEPPQLNSAKASDVESGFILGHVMEGLTRYSKKTDGSVEPGVAESWTIDNKGATFKLRKNAKWSDGKPVTAKDFIFAWRTAVDPKTASEYAFIIFPIKNAEAISSGKMPVTALGATAPDDYTVKVEFEKPTGYFLSLTAFQTYYPIREDFYNARGSKYSAEATDLLYNGPFKITKWKHSASITMERNEHYWNQKLSKLDKIEVPYITPDNTAKYNFFKDGKVDVLTPLSPQDIEKANKDGFRRIATQDSSIWFMQFNMREGRKATSNKNLRKAMELAFNTHRKEHVESVIKIPGTKTAYSLVPSNIKGNKKLFLQEYPPTPPKGDLVTARQYLDKAKKELGGSIPAIIWLCDDTPHAKAEAEFYQSIFKKDLGLDIKIDSQSFKQRIAKMNAGDFDVVQAGWGPDYPDPMTYADLMASWNENNRGHWVNKDYDALIKKAQSTTDNAVRMKAMADAQLILREEAALITTYERTINWTQQKEVSGVIRRAFGPDPDFTHADKVVTQ